MKRRLNDIYVRYTGQDYETIERTLDRDYFLSAEEAREFGIIDEVITKRHPLEEKDRETRAGVVEPCSGGRSCSSVRANRRIAGKLAVSVG